MTLSTSPNPPLKVRPAAQSNMRRWEPNMKPAPQVYSLAQCSLAASHCQPGHTLASFLGRQLQATQESQQARQAALRDRSDMLRAAGSSLSLSAERVPDADRLRAQCITITGIANVSKKIWIKHAFATCRSDARKTTIYVTVETR